MQVATDPTQTTNETTWGITIGETADALAWRDRHHEHVVRLLASREGEIAYPPSGSDCRHPELWRAPHWRWLKDQTP